MFQVPNVERARTLVSTTETAKPAAAAAPKKQPKTKAFNQEASNQAEARKKAAELKKEAAAKKRMLSIQKGSNEYKKLVNMITRIHANMITRIGIGQRVHAGTGFPRRTATDCNADYNHSDVRQRSPGRNTGGCCRPVWRNAQHWCCSDDVRVRLHWHGYRPSSSVGWRFSHEALDQQAGLWTAVVPFGYR